MRRLLLAALLSLAVPSAAEAKPFTVGTGQNGGIAIDDGGTVYVGWQVNVYDPGDAVQFCVIPPRARRCALADHDRVPRPGLQPLARLRPAAGPRRGRRDRAAHRRPRRVLLPRALHRRRAHVRRAGPGHRREFAEGVLGPGGRIAFADGPTTTRAGLFAPDGSSARSDGSELGPFLEGVFTDIASNGTEVLAAGSDAQRHPRLPAPGRRRSQHRRRVAADRSARRASASRSSPACPAASPRCSSRRAPARNLYVTAPRARRLGAAREHHARRQQLGLPARRQRQGPAERGDHLLRLPPALHDLDRRRRAVVLAGQHRELPQVPERRSRSPPTPPAPAPRSVDASLDDKRVRVTPLHAAQRAGRPPPHPRHARPGPQRLRRRPQALARRRGRPRHPPRQPRLGAPPRELRAHARRAPRLPQPLPRALLAAPPPRAHPRAARSRAAARPARCGCACVAAARRS